MAARITRCSWRSRRRNITTRRSICGRRRTSATAGRSARTSDRGAARRDRLPYFLSSISSSSSGTPCAHAKETKGIQIIGDIPIYVSADSSDVWTHPELFKLKSDLSPKLVAGVPPDYYSATGQLWGNPVYNWAAHKKTGYAWWIWRMKSNMALFDVVRLDHFRGFAAYWEVDAAEDTAVNGKWRKGPGMELFRAIEKALGPIPLIAEDLGVQTDEVRELFARERLPGHARADFRLHAGL